MINIGILEYHYHSIFYYALAKICKTKNTNVTLFTTKKLFNEVTTRLKNTDDYQIILKKDNETINSFLHRVEDYCEKTLDILFINTIQESLKDLPHYFTFNPRCKTVLTIHDANTWLNPKIRYELRRPIRTLDTILSTIFIKHRILPQFDAINVIYPPIKEYIHSTTPYHKPVFTLPFMIYEESRPSQKKKPSDPIHFVVPGEIIKTRRNHELIMNVFEQLFNQFKTQIKLTLLGRPRGQYGEQILDRCKKLKNIGYNIDFFSEFVPEKIYDEILKQSDLIIVPIKVQTTSLGTIQEIFGTTKASGVSFEPIQYAKPLVVPQDMQVIQQMKNSTITYTDQDDLIRNLTRFIKDTKYQSELSLNAQRNAEHFSLPRYQKYFEKEVLATLLPVEREKT